MLEEYFKGLIHNDFRYVVLRGYESLPDKVRNDIDFGIHKEDLENCIVYTNKYLAEQGYSLVHKARKFHYTQVYFYNPHLKEHLHIDFWTGFYYKGLVYKNIENVLSNRRLTNSIYIPAAQDELAVSFLKELIHNNRVRDDKVEKLRSLVNDGMIEGFYPYFQEEIIAQFKSEIFGVGGSKVFEENNFVINYLEESNTKVHGLVRKSINKLKYYFTETRLLNQNDGLLIVLIGPDGSGKTTTSNAIKDHIVKTFFSGMEYFHFRFGIIPELNNLLSVFSKKKKTKAEVDVGEAPVQTSSPSYGRKLIYTIYYLLDFFLGNFRMRIHRYRNKLVLFDRYYFDYFIHNDYKRIPQVLKYVYRALAPKPDLLVYLKADAEAIYERKPELSIQEISEQQAAIELLMKQQGFYNASVTVNTDGGVETVVESIRKVIFEIKSASNV